MTNDELFILAVILYISIIVVLVITDILKKTKKDYKELVISAIEIGVFFSPIMILVLYTVLLLIIDLMKCW